VLATWTGAATPDRADLDSNGSESSTAARGVPGFGTFATADNGYVTLGVITEDHFWRAVCTVLGMDDVSQLVFVDRVQRLDELQARLASSIAARHRDELVDELLASGAPAAPVLDRVEMLALPHLRERAVATADPWSDPATGHPVRFAHHAAARNAPPPALDEHHGSGFLPRDHA
jgi:crotonobetainyl-CoA:carnitine CoA-transferase CaiB-like acyl-CoA transferase